MKFYSKSEIKEMLGSYGFFDSQSGNTLVDVVKYMEGLDIIDKEASNSNILIEKIFIYITPHPKGLRISFDFGIFNTKHIALFSEDINYWSTVKKDEILNSKSNSVVGNALAGGLLFGPVGAIVGSMVARGSGNTSGLLTISYHINNEDKVILFSCKNLSKVYTCLYQSIKEKYKTFEEIISEGSSKDSSISVADELRKLKQLLDENIITEEEFANQKAKLLS